MKKQLALLMLLGPLSMFAQGFQIHTQGIKQQAMGNAGAAYVQDAATIYYNPGGLAFVNDNGAILGSNVIIAKSAFLDSRAKTVSNSTGGPSVTGQFYTSYGFDSLASGPLQNMRVGLGVYTPFGAGVEYADDWFGRFVVRKFALSTLNLQPTVSYSMIDGKH